MAFEAVYESYTPYEAGMFQQENPAAFARIMENMRHTLRRRAATLKKYGRTDTAGYEKIMEALETTRGKRSAENFSRLSIVYNTKMTKYTEQIRVEKQMFESAQEKYGLEVPKEKRGDIMKLVRMALNTKLGQLRYKENKEEFWTSAVEAASSSKPIKAFFKALESMGQ